MAEHSAAKYAEMGQVLEAIQISGYLMFLNPYEAKYYQLASLEKINRDDASWVQKAGPSEVCRRLRPTVTAPQAATTRSSKAIRH